VGWPSCCRTFGGPRATAEGGRLGQLDRKQDKGFSYQWVGWGGSSCFIFCGNFLEMFFVRKLVGMFWTNKQWAEREVVVTLRCRLLLVRQLRFGELSA